MFIPTIVLIAFCLIKKIKFSELGLKSFKLKFWPTVFGLMLIICAVNLLSVLWFSDYPNFININGKWKLENVATIFPQPNKPIVLLLIAFFRCYWQQ
jgi:hypothetical protein